MKLQIVLVSIVSFVLVYFACGLVADVVAAPADAGVALVAPFDAGAELAPSVGSGSSVAVPAPVPEPVIDPVAQPLETASLVVRLWRGGTIPASLIVGLFALLTVASRKVAYLRNGYAALITAAALGGLVILLEPATRGTTPTLPMVWAAVLAAVTIAIKGKPEPKAAT